MTFRLTCIVNPRDIINHPGGSAALLSDFSDALTKASAFPIQKESQGYNTLSFLVESEQMPDLAPFLDAVKKVSADLGTKEADLSFSEVSEEAESARTVPSRETASPAARPETPEPQTPPKDDSDPYGAILDLVGMEEIKTWASKINAIKPAKTAAHTAAITGVSYLLAIDPGNGCSHLLDRMSRLLASKLQRKADFQEVTPKASEENEWHDFESVVKKAGLARGNGTLTVFGIHLDDFLSRLRSDGFPAILRQIKKTENQVTVFIVPYLENRALQSIWEQIDDVIPCRILRVPPYTESDLFTLFGRFFSGYGLTTAEDCRAPLSKKIMLEKSDGRFYGVETVRKICDEVLYEKLLSGSDSDTVTAEDVTAVLPKAEETDELTGEQQLDRLIALDEVKKRVKEICATIAWEKKNGENTERSMHMMFSGAPGTGKTAVARIVGKMLKETGVLSRGEFFEVSRKDLVGRFVGHTAPKTASACRMAYGSVLFIDEAYALAGGSDNDYGAEAISALIAEMENNRSRLVVIFAGYEKELTKLFDLNPGLRDRIPYHLVFPHYSREELKDIFFSMLPKSFSYGEDFKTRAEEYFRNLSDEIVDDEHFSNARFVRNIVERVLSKAALRLSGAGGGPGGLLAVSDFDLAVSDAEFKDLSKRKYHTKIGF